MKRIASFNFETNNQYQIPLPAGWYKGIMLSLEATNEAAQTMTRANCGDIRLYRGGVKIWEITLEKLWYFVDRQMLGAQQFSSAVGAAIQAVFYIPFHFGDNNVVRLGDNYVLEFSHSDLSAVITAATMTVLGQPALGQERYFPIFQNFTIRALTNLTQPERLDRKNLAYAVIDFSSNHTHYRLMKGENYVYDMSDEEADFQTALESVNETYAANSSTVPTILSLYKEKSLVQIAGKGDTRLGVVSSDTTFSGFTVEFELNPTKQALSNDIVNRIAREKAGNDAELTNILS